MKFQQGMKNYFKFLHSHRFTDKLILRDYLALERTRLANERTLLSYIRTSLYFLLGGIALLQIEGFGNITWLGYSSLFLCVTLLLIGVVRFMRLTGRLFEYYDKKEVGKFEHESGSIL